MKLRLRARHLLGYASTPVKVCMSPEGPTWKVHSPLTTFPSLTYDEGIWPSDCISVYTRTLGWLQDRYPEGMSRVYKGDSFVKPGRDQVYELLEYADDAEVVLVVVGAKPPGPEGQVPALARKAVELERYPNRAGRPLVVCPAAITLDRRSSQFDGMLGQFQARARLMALSIIATERGIFQDEWLVSRQGETPQIIQVPNPKTGQVGIVKGGDLQPRPVDPQFQTNQTIDRIEYSERQTGSIPPEFGGSSSTNVRTGRRGAQIMSATIDFFVEEAQTLLAKSLQIENRIYVALEKAYMGEAPRSFWLNWKGNTGRVDYTPNKLWVTDENHVSYALAGADTDALVIGAGQRVGMETMSKHRFMEIDPLVPDVEAERDRIRFEGLEAAFFSSIQTLGRATRTGRTRRPTSPASPSWSAPTRPSCSRPSTMVDEEIAARAGRAAAGRGRPDEPGGDAGHRHVGHRGHAHREPGGADALPGELGPALARAPPAADASRQRGLDAKRPPDRSRGAVPMRR